MKVKATKLFGDYRNAVLGLELKDFRSLQSGKEVDIPKELFNKYPKIFEEIKKDGDSRNSRSRT